MKKCMRSFGSCSVIFRVLSQLFKFLPALIESGDLDFGGVELIDEGGDFGKACGLKLWIMQICLKDFSVLLGGENGGFNAF